MNFIRETLTTEHTIPGSTNSLRRVELKNFFII